jgi:hypothetical protein
MKRECESCIKRKTPYCPNSGECMTTENMPYYQNRIMLLEENKQLKEKVNKLEILIESLYLGVTLNQEEEDLLDKVLFGSDSNE